MAEPSAPVEDGDIIVDVNGVVWVIRLDTSRTIPKWRATVTTDSVRAYDTPDEEPVVNLDTTPTKTVREMTDKVNAFAGPMKQNLILRVRASPDAKSNIGALLLAAIVLYMLDKK